MPLMGFGFSQRELKERRMPTAVQARAEVFRLFETLDFDPDGKYENIVPASSLSSAEEWFVGAAPCAGWWNCVDDVSDPIFLKKEASYFWRFWDGEQWSIPALWEGKEEFPRSEYLENKKKVLYEKDKPMFYRLKRAPWDVDADGFHPYTSTEGMPPLPDTARFQYKLRASSGVLTASGKTSLYDWKTRGHRTDLVAHKELS